jgi:hypothetical protein
MSIVPAVTLSGILNSIAGASDQGRIIVTLVNFGAFIPEVVGTTSPPVTGLELSEISQVVSAASNGTWSVSLFANVQLSPANTFYQISVFPANSNAPTQVAAYLLAPGSFDLSSLTPLVPPDPPLPAGVWDWDSLAGIPASITSAPTNIAAEIVRAEAAEGVLTSSISTEITNRVAAIATEVSARNTAISVETTRAETAEGVLTTAIGTETTRAEAAEAALAASSSAAAGTANQIQIYALGKLAASAATATVAGTIDIPANQQLTWGISSHIGISEQTGNANVLCIGNGTAGDFSKHLKLTNIYVNGTVTDGSASVGTSGQVLSSTGTATQWVTPTVYDTLGAAATETTRAEAAEALLASTSSVTTAIAVETSRATTAEALLAPKASPTFTGTVSGITAAMVGAPTTAAMTTAIGVETTRAEAAEALLAPIASPTFTGVVTTPSLVVSAASGATHQFKVIDLGGGYAGVDLGGGTTNPAFYGNATQTIITAQGGVYLEIVGSPKVYATSTGVQLSNGPLVWSSTVNANGVVDTGISRLAAGSLAVGNGTAADISGTVSAAVFALGATPASQGYLRMAYAGGFFARNSANSGDVRLLTINTVSTTNELVFGSGGGLGPTGIRFTPNADAMYMSSSGVQLNTVLGWTGGTFVTNPSDTGISRLGAGSLAIGNGTASDKTGKLTLGTLTTTGAVAVASAVNIGGNGSTLGTAITMFAPAADGGKAYIQANYWGSTQGVMFLGNYTYPYALGVQVDGSLILGATPGDTGISRISAGLIGVGTGAQGSYAGSLKLTGLNLVGAHTDSLASTGTSGQVLSSTGTATQWITNPAGFSNPMTTGGDIIYESVSPPTPTRLPIGTTGQVLTIAAGIPSWATPAAGGGGLPYTIVQDILLNSGSSAVTSYTVTFPQALAASGNTAFLMISCDGSNTFSLPAGWTIDINQTQATYSRFVLAHKTSAGDTSVLISQGGGGSAFGVYFMELVGSHALDQSSMTGAATTNTTPDYIVPGAITPTAGSVVYGVAATTVNSPLTYQQPYNAGSANSYNCFSTAPQLNGGRMLIVFAGQTAAKNVSTRPPAIPLANQLQSGLFNSGGVAYGSFSIL